jgi:hypothetical protein
MMQQQECIQVIKESHLKKVSEVGHPDPHVNYLANTGHCPYLIHVTLEREWFYINGEKDLGFKTRGNNKRDLRNALIKYNIDYWESDLEQCAKMMADQLYWQAQKKHELIKVEATA